MKRKIGELILIIFFYLLQVTLGRVIAIGGIKPNLLIILPVLFGFLHGKNEGMYVGFFAGFFYDLFFFDKIQQCEDDIKNGRVCTLEELRQHINELEAKYANNNIE